MIKNFVIDPITRLTGVILLIRELKHTRFWDVDGNQKWAIFTFNLPLHNHIHIGKYLKLLIESDQSVIQAYWSAVFLHYM